MRQRSWAAALVGTAVGFAATTAAGQSIQNGEFSVQRFLPAPGNQNILSVEGARIDGHLAFSAGVFVNYANNPLVLQVSGPTGTSDVNIIRDLMTVDVMAALSLFRHVQVAVRIPYMSVKGDGIQADQSSWTAGQASRSGLQGSGIGDPMFELKVRAVSLADNKLVLGASGYVTAPAGKSPDNYHYIGDETVGGGGRAIVDFAIGRLQLAANIGGAYRGKGTLGNTTVGSELRYGVGASFKVAPLLYILGETFGATKLTSESGTSALEAIGAVKVLPFGPRIAFTAGAGAGVVEGVGVPSYRLLAGATFTTDIPDQDGDGIADDQDSCPTLAEDKDGFQDEDGCPDPDNDGDGISDTSDKCPSEPETLNGFEDDDGCPDQVPDRDKDGVSDAEDKCPDEGGTPIILRRGDFFGCADRDKDGVPDKVDKCPDAAEDTDGHEDEDGCPDNDNDNDGVPDQSDECPDQKEVMNGYKDEDGCPDEVPDRDGDGIPDNVDRCPEAPETYNGIADDDGCPDGASLVDATANQLRIKDVINFANDSDKIVGKKSFSVLDAISALLKHHPEIFKIEVGGHTDDKGDRDHNVDLSKRRADAVVAYLVDKGIDAKRLTSAGFGPDKPIIEKKTAAARAKNRRVEFNIVQAAPKSGAAPSKPGGAEPAPTTAPRAKPTKPAGGGKDLGDL